MFLTTGEKKYLNYNLQVVRNLKASSVETVEHGQEIMKWFWPVNRKNGIQEKLAGKEVMLYEGYLLRYVAKFMSILDKNKHIMSKKERDVVFNFVKINFDKLYNRSIVKYNDYSLFFRTRTHIASHWATIALFLNDNSRIKKDKKYIKIIKLFDEQLRVNLKIKKIKLNEYFQWNSNWENSFTSLQKTKETPRIQDVSHGNQVVDYILESHKVGSEEWTIEDVNRLINTVKLKIFDEENITFYDKIDGSNFDSENRLKNTGWKQSAGWMKLSLYDNELLNIYRKWYMHNSKFLDKTYFNLQIYANFLYVEHVNNKKG